MNIAVEGAEIVVTRPNDDKENRSLHGLTRTLIHNMIVGVTEGFKKELEVNGVGYRVQKQGKDLVMNLGYSHQVIVPETDEHQDRRSGSEQDHYHMASTSRRLASLQRKSARRRPPEPYKGKGIKYIDEVDSPQGRQGR